MRTPLPILSTPPRPIPFNQLVRDEWDTSIVGDVSHLSAARALRDPFPRQMVNLSYVVVKSQSGEVPDVEFRTGLCFSRLIRDVAIEGANAIKIRDGALLPY